MVACAYARRSAPPDDGRLSSEWLKILHGCALRTVITVPGRQIGREEFLLCPGVLLNVLFRRWARSGGSTVAVELNLICHWLEGTNQQQMVLARIAELIASGRLCPAQIAFLRAVGQSLANWGSDSYLGFLNG